MEKPTRKTPETSKVENLTSPNKAQTEARKRQPLPELSPRTFRSDVIQYLRSAILAGDFPPGSTLVEREISEEMGVSRAPIREAIQRLENEGLVVTVPYTGTYVTVVGDDQRRQMQSLRYVLDAMAAEKALPHLDSSVIHQLKKYVLEMAEIIESKQFNQFYVVHNAFHRVFYELAGNLLLLNIWQMMERLYQLYSLTNPMPDGNMSVMVEAHTRYITVLESLDAQKIHEEVIDHVRRYAGPH